jgi:hypothetical protein
LARDLQPEEVDYWRRRMSNLSDSIRAHRNRLAEIEMQIDAEMQGRLREMDVADMSDRDLRDRRVVLLRDYLDFLYLFTNEIERRTNVRERNLMKRLALLEKKCGLQSSD